MKSLASQGKPGLWCLQQVAGFQALRVIPGLWRDSIEQQSPGVCVDTHTSVLRLWVSRSWTRLARGLLQKKPVFPASQRWASDKIKQTEWFPSWDSKGIIKSAVEYETSIWPRWSHREAAGLWCSFPKGTGSLPSPLSQSSGGLPSRSPDTPECSGSRCVQQVPPLSTPRRQNSATSPTGDLHWSHVSKAWELETAWLSRPVGLPGSMLLRCCWRFPL